METNLDEIVDMLRQSYNRGKRSSIIVVVEGNEVGHTVEIARHVGYALKTSCRVCVLGHIQRGGSPTAKDRILASKLGAAAIKGLLNGKEGHAAGESKGQIVYIPFRDTWTKKKQLDMNLLKSAKVLAL